MTILLKTDKGTIFTLSLYKQMPRNEAISYVRNILKVKCEIL